MANSDGAGAPEGGRGGFPSGDERFHGGPLEGILGKKGDRGDGAPGSAARAGQPGWQHRPQHAVALDEVVGQGRRRALGADEPEEEPGESDMQDLSLSLYPEDVREAQKSTEFTTAYGKLSYPPEGCTAEFTLV